MSTSPIVITFACENEAREKLDRIIATFDRDPRTLFEALHFLGGDAPGLAVEAYFAKQRGELERSALLVRAAAIAHARAFIAEGGLWERPTRDESGNHVPEPESGRAILERARVWGMAMRPDVTEIRP